MNGRRRGGGGEMDKGTVTDSGRILGALDRLLAALFWAALALVFLRPSSLRFPTPFGRVSLTSAKNISVAFSLLWLACAVARPRRYFVSAGLGAPLALFMAASALSAAASPFGPARERWAAVAEAGFYAAFFHGALRLLRDSGRARAAAAAMVAAAAVVAAVDLAHHARAGLAFIVDQGYPLWDGKNALGLFMAIALPIGLSLPAARRRGGAPAAALAPALLLILLCALYSYSRAAWLALGAAALCLAALRSWRWIWLPVAAAVALAFPPPHRLGRRPAATGMARDRTAAWRVVVWRDAALMIRDRPILGVGPGEFRRACAVYEDRGGPAPGPARSRDALRYREHAHNLFLQVGAETGLAGLAALIGAGALAARAAARWARASPGLGSGTAAALAAFAAYSLADSTWSGRFSGSSFMHINLVAAVLAAMSFNGAHSAPGPGRRY